MSRPRTRDEYLARMVPPSVTGTHLSRRNLLRAALGAGAVMGAPALLGGCGEEEQGGTATETGTWGSNRSDDVPKATLAATAAAFTASSGVSVKINTVDHNTFQESITTYLQGRPDDVFTWFAGYRMQYFAAKGFVSDVSDVWQGLHGYTDAVKKASTDSGCTVQ